MVCKRATRGNCSSLVRWISSFLMYRSGRPVPPVGPRLEHGREQATGRAELGGHARGEELTS